MERYENFNSSKLEVHSVENIFFEFPLNIIHGIVILVTGEKNFHVFFSFYKNKTALYLCYLSQTRKMRPNIYS